MLTEIVIYILSCFLVSLIINIYSPFKEGESPYLLERYIVNVVIGFVSCAFIAPLIIAIIILCLFLLGVSIAIILFSTVGCIYLLNSYFGSVLFGFT